MIEALIEGIKRKDWREAHVFSIPKPSPKRRRADMSLDEVPP